MNKKSLISTIKTTKKANVAKEALRATTTSSVKSPSLMLGHKLKMSSAKTKSGKIS